MSEPKIFCSYDRLMSPARLKPHPLNRNEHPREQIARLAEMLMQGIRRPITVSLRSGYIIRGHGTRLAAMKAKITRFPVDYQKYSTAEDELADMVADSAIKDGSALSGNIIKQLMTGFDDSAVKLSGFSAGEFDSLMNNPAPKEVKPKRERKSMTLKVSGIPATKREEITDAIAKIIQPLGYELKTY